MRCLRFAAVATLLVSMLAVAGVGHAAPGPVTISIDYPVQGQRVRAGTVELRGRIDAGGQSEVTTVVYVVDVSGSTASPSGNDCNGDHTDPPTAADDLNNDGNVGDTLDCEISAVAALNGSLRAVPASAERIRVGLVAFGSAAAAADVAPDTGEQHFVAPGATGGERDVTPHLLASAASLRQGSVDQFTHHDVGQSTNFDAAVETALTSLDEAPNGPRWIMFLSDGQAGVSAETLNRLRGGGARLRTFAVGSGSTCDPQTALATMAEATGESCTAVSDPSTLASDVLGSRPGGVESVVVNVDGQTTTADLDAIGNWKAQLPLQAGRHRAIATAMLAGGVAGPTAQVDFEVGVTLRYVALGDSYSAGEGIEPFIDQPRNIDEENWSTSRDYFCHRSEKAYSRQVQLPGATRPIVNDAQATFVFAACSGARIVNLDTEQQVKQTYSGTTLRLPLQFGQLSADTDLVTTTIGGNDGGFAEILKHCATQLSCWEDGFVTLHRGTPQERGVSLEDWANARLPVLENELKSVYRAVRTQTSNNASVVVLTYPHLLATGLRPFCSEAAAFTRPERQFLSNLADRADDSILRSAEGAGVWSIDVRDRFNGHTVCNHNSWVNGATGRRGTDLSSGIVGDGSFHPTSRGATEYARAINQFLSDHAHDAAVNAAGLPRNPEPRTQPAGPAATFAAAALQTAGNARGAAQASTGQLSPADLELMAKTTFHDVGLIDLAAARGHASCPDRVSAGEVVPVRGVGFAPGSAVHVSLADARGRTRDLGTVRADSSGDVSASVVMPAAMAPKSSDNLVRVHLEGINLDQAPALGSAITHAGGSARCARKAAKARVLFDSPHRAPAPEPVLGAQPCRCHSGHHHSRCQSRHHHGRWGRR